jgi:steroid delta-isomerase-like uncharacterized protein
MSERNKATVRKFYEAINTGRFEIVDEVVAEDFVEHEVFPGLGPGREGVRQMFTMMRSAFPDLRMVIEDMIAEGDKVFVRGRMTGTNKGEFNGMAPTGRSMNVPFADFLRFADGRAVEHWGVTDSGTMMQQLAQTEQSA